MTPTPTPSPAPAPTPLCEAFDRKANRDAKEPLNMADVYGDLFDFARDLERTLAQRETQHTNLREAYVTLESRLAQRDAEVARLNDENATWVRSYNMAKDQLRAAEERAVRAEQEQSRLTLVAQQQLNKLSELHALRARLSSVAEDIEKTGVAEAFESFPSATAPVGSKDGWVVYSQWEKHCEKCNKALVALTALLSKLRSDGAHPAKTKETSA
jgi:chromosome segregation ATPase